MNAPDFASRGYVDQFAARLTTGLAAGTAAAVMRGGRVVVQQIATDAFGNALGWSLASASTAAPTQTQGQGPYSSADYRNGADIDSDNAHYDRITQQALRSSGAGLSDSATDAELMAYRMGQAGLDGELTPTGDRLQLSRGSNDDPRVLELQSRIARLSAIGREAGALGASMNGSISDRLNRESVIREFEVSAPIGLGDDFTPAYDGLGELNTEAFDAGATSVFDLGARFAEGAFYGALDMVWQPVAQVLDLSQAAYGLASGGSYEPNWLSGTARNYAAGMSWAETGLRAMTGAPLVGQALGVGLASYDLTGSAIRGDWGAVAEYAGGLVVGAAAVKYGSQYFAPEPGAQLGIKRLGTELSYDIVDTMGISGGQLLALPANKTNTFNGIPVSREFGTGI